MKASQFLDFKLGKYKHYHINFHFFSRNKGKKHYGKSDKVSLILDTASGVKKLRKKLKSHLSYKELKAENEKLQKKVEAQLRLAKEKEKTMRKEV